MNFHSQVNNFKPDRPRVSFSSNSAMPLVLADQGDKLIVRAIKSDKSQSRRLADLGLRVGKTINIIQKNRAGVVVGIQGLRLAIGPSQAKNILVSSSAE